MIIDETQKSEYVDFANSVLGVHFDHGRCMTITALDEAGKILAVTVFNMFSEFNCEMSIATDGRKRWFSRQYAKQCYSYPFLQLGLRRVTGVAEEDNEAALNLNRKLGHVEEARLKHWFGAKDGILFRMLKEECKWL